jgi:hypothetical protein
MTSMNLGLTSAQLGTGTFNYVLQITLTNITTGPPPQSLGFAFTGSAMQLTPSMHTWVNSNNGLFAITGDLANTGKLGVPNSGTIGFNGGVPYSMTTEVDLVGTVTGLATLGLNDNNQIPGPAVPAPAGLVLALTGLPALGLAYLRRRSKPVAV